MIDRVVTINDFAVGGGGAAALAILSAIEFRRRGLAVTYITGDDASNPALASAGVEEYAVGGRPLLGNPLALISGLYNRTAYRKVKSWIDRNDTPGTIYHLHNWSQILSPAIFSALRPVAERVVLSAHDFFFSCPNGAFANYQKSTVCKLRPMSLPCITTHCDSRSYLHKLWRVSRGAVLSFVRGLGRTDVPLLVIHEGMIPFFRLDGLRLSNIITVRNPVRGFTITRVPAERNRKFLFVGRIHQGKGPDVAARAARIAGVPLQLIGEGPLRQKIEADCPEVTITGWQSREEITGRVQDARVVVIPSRYPEPFGLVALEALLSGIPVLLASSAFLAEEIVALGAGLVCDPADLAGFAAAMKTMADDDERIARMSQAAFQSARSLAPDTPEWIDRLLAIYGERLGSSEVERRIARAS